MKFLSKHLLIASAIIFIVGLTYLRIPSTYFCGYDDFIEVHRAAFEDSNDSRRVFTTSHFSSYKYRPLNRGLNLLTYWLGDGSATFFRARNVLFHLANVLLVYLLGWVLFGRILVSGAAALLFGLHPLANQPVVGAVMTNSAAHACFLLALVTFMMSLRRPKYRLALLTFALFSGWLSLLTYEAGIVIFPLLITYTVVCFFQREKLINRRYFVVIIFGSIFLVGIYFWMRSSFVPYSAREAVPSITVLLKNALMYAGALLLPVDSVLANEWLGTPLPSQIEMSLSSRVWWLIVLCALFTLAIVIWLIRSAFGRRLLASIQLNHLFLMLAILATIAPLLVFTNKASETYIYLPVAFAALSFSSIMQVVFAAGHVRSSNIAFLAIVLLLSVLFGSATWVRNRRVVRCGVTAHRIFSSLRQDKLKDGSWFIRLAAVADEPKSEPYGMYGWRGLDTIGATAVQPAVQLANGNRLLNATIVAPEFLRQDCSESHDLCISVHEDGRVQLMQKPVVKSQ